MQVAAYSFDESGDTVLDVTQSGGDFLLTANAVRVAGHVSGGAIQPATTTAVQLPDIGQSDDRTVCMWIKGSVPDAWPIQWYDPLADSGAGAGAWGILFLSGNPVIRARNNADQFTSATAAWPDTTGWHHVAGVYGGGSVRLYLDGVLADQKPLVGPIRASNAPTLFGYASGTGVYDDLRVYDSALGQASVTASMDPVASSDLASAAALSVNAGFLARVTAAMQQYAVAVAKQIRSTNATSRKAEYLLAQRCLLDPALYGAQFGWAVGSDAAVDPTVDDDTIRQKVQDAWPIIAYSI